MGIRLPAPNNANLRANLEDFGNVELKPFPWINNETLIYIGGKWRILSMEGDYINDATANITPNSVVRRNGSSNINANDVYCDELFIDKTQYTRIRQNNNKIELRVNGTTYPVVNTNINNTFTSADGKTITVSGAVITNIS